MTEQVPTVSIIVPIYNVEDWLALCCDSLIAQTWTDWEAVLLVDGSPDDSISIARRYAEQDSRFVVKEIANRGLGGARNAAMDVARGEYLFFMDSDDELTPRALEMLMLAAERTDSDIVAGFGQDFDEFERRTRYWTYGAEQFHRRPGTYTLDQMPSLTDDHTAWGKVIRRQLIDSEQLSFPEGVHCEDIVFSLKSQLTANQISIVTEPVYLHRRHGAAISADYLRPKTLGDWLQEAGRTLDIIADADEALRHHYVMNHTLRQWMTRATGFDRIADAEHLAGVESMAARILELGKGGIDELNSYPVALLRAFAAHIPSERWSSVEGSPLVAPAPDSFGASAPALLAIGDTLDLSAADEASIAVALVLHGVVGPLANGISDPDAERLLSRAAAVLDAAGQPALESSTLQGLNAAGPLPPRSREAALELLSGRVTCSSAVTRIRSSNTQVSLTGHLSTAHAQHGPEHFQLVAVTESGRVLTSPAGVTRSGDDIVWHAVVPKSAVDAGPVSLRLRRIRRYAAPADLVLTLDAEAPTDVQVTREAPLALQIDSAGRDQAVTVASEQKRLYTFPNWYSNPYMTMLHAEPAGDGYELPGTVDPNAFMRELKNSRSHGPIHIHWTSPLIEKRESKEKAEAFVDDFISALEKARSRGRGVLWTVHNALPHDSKYPETAIRLHAEIARVADIIHVLSAPTVDAINGVYELPEHKVRVLEHSSYVGVYGDREPMSVAREAVGASPEARTVLFFGQLRPYKGLDQLFDASILLQEQHPVELLLAGKPAPELKDELRRIKGSGVEVTSALRFIEDNEVAAWFSAADVTVLPYRKVLNSGSMMLAATFGVPLVLPAEEALLADYGDEPWIRFFDTERAAASIAEILADDWYLQSEARQAALDFARGRSPVAMSRGYAELLREAQALAAKSI